MQIINKLPSIIRWILVPFVSLGGGILIHMILMLILTTGIALGFVNGSFNIGFAKFFFIPSISGFFCVYFPVIFAPSYKIIIAISALVIWLIWNIFGMSYAANVGVNIPWTDYLEVFIFVLGSVLACYLFYKD